MLQALISFAQNVDLWSWKSIPRQGLEGIETATGKDVAGMIIEHIEKNYLYVEDKDSCCKNKNSAAFEIGGLYPARTTNER